MDNRTHDAVSFWARQLLTSLVSFLTMEELYQPGLGSKLASKVTEEIYEFVEAHDAYKKCLKDGATMHQFNDAWLHLVDEAADAINCTAASVAFDKQPVSNAVYDISFILEDFIEDGDYSYRQAKDLRYALESAAIAKVKITALRAHWTNSSIERMRDEPEEDEYPFRFMGNQETLED